MIMHDIPGPSSQTPVYSFREIGLDVQQKDKYDIAVTRGLFPSSYAPIAQWIEQPPSKRWVAGSIPAGRVNCNLSQLILDKFYRDY